MNTYIPVSSGGKIGILQSLYYQFHGNSRKTGKKSKDGQIYGKEKI